MKIANGKSGRARRKAASAAVLWTSERVERPKRRENSERIEKSERELKYREYWGERAASERDREEERERDEELPGNAQDGRILGRAALGGEERSCCERE